MILVTRYPFEFIAAILLLGGAYYGLYYGAEWVGLTAISSQPEVAVVGYACWLVLMCGFNNMSAEISSEAGAGTLSNIFLSSYSTLAILAVRSSVAIIMSIILAVGAMVVVAAGTHVTLTPTFWVLVPALSLFASSIGMGLLVAGLAIVLKRISLLLLPLQFVLMALAITLFEALPTNLYNASLALPTVPSLVALRALLIHGLPPNPGLLLLGFLNAGAYIAIGLFCFRMLAMLARRHGSLAEY
jgi:ABC-2 type transport system permease protein